MNSLNSILLEGNLTRDPESRTIASGGQVCNFTIASNRFYRQNETLEKETGFFDIEAWARLGQTCAETLRKGRGVRVVGRLRQDRWNDQTGKSHSRVKIVAEHVEFKPMFKPAEGADSKPEEEPKVPAESRIRDAEPVF